MTKRGVSGVATMISITIMAYSIIQLFLLFMFGCVTTNQNSTAIYVMYNRLQQWFSIVKAFQTNDSHNSSNGLHHHHLGTQFLTTATPVTSSLERNSRLAFGRRHWCYRRRWWCHHLPYLWIKARCRKQKASFDIALRCWGLHVIVNLLERCGVWWCKQ